MKKGSHKMDDIFNDLNYLFKCQQFVIDRTNFLENKRVNILNRLKNMEHEINNEEKGTLINRVILMEINVNRKFDSNNDKTYDVHHRTEGKRCRYNNRGVCKMEDSCRYLHSHEICNEFISEGKCSQPHQCYYRHPKDCKYWVGDARGCWRGDQCKFLHKASKKGIKVKDFEDKSDNNKKVEAETEKESVEKETGITVNEINDEERNKVTKVMELTQTLAHKEKEVKDLNDKTEKLLDENVNLKKEVEKLTRVAKNLHNALKSKSS